MLVLILDPATTLTAVFSDADADALASFAPAPQAIGTCVADCAALMAVDPQIVTDCQAALAGATIGPRDVCLHNAARVTRRLIVQAGDDAPKTIMVAYTHPSDVNAPAQARQIEDPAKTKISKLADDVLRRSAAINATEDGLGLSNAAGIMIDANPALARIFGCDDVTSLLGRRWDALFMPSFAQELHNVALPMLATSGKWRGSCTIPALDGQMREVDIKLTALHGDIVIWIVHDNTERNALNRQLLGLREQIERAQRQEIVNLIAAGFTHDLTNLVALISHLSEPAMRDHFRTNRDVLDEIHCAARQMVALLEPIKHLGRRHATTARLDLAELITEAASILHIAAPNGLRIQTAIDATDLHVQGDKMQVMQVLLNLGLNAREAVGDGAQTITLALTQADALPDDAKLETGLIPAAPFALLSVTDTGPGIDRATRTKIWEPYFTTKTVSGTGLGLFVVADIVRAAGGGIALKTRHAEGTTFYIALPLAQET